MAKPNNYRRDFRTKTTFAENIATATKIEKILMVAYVEWLNRLKSPTDDHYSFKDNGIDNTGAVIEDDSKITMEADFILCHRGKRNRKIDIKFCRNDTDGTDNPASHLKVNQLVQYVQDDVCVINFMGINTPEARFCILTPHDLSEWLKHGQRVEFRQWGGKECIRLPNTDVTWYKVDLGGQKFD